MYRRISRAALLATFNAALLASPVIARAGSPGPTFRAAAEGEIPPPPSVLVRVGEHVVMRSDMERILEMAPILQARRRAVDEGKWDTSDEVDFAELRARLEKEARRDILRRAVIRETALGSGYEPDEMGLERRLRSAIRHAGGVESLEREHGQSLDQLREQLRESDLKRHFYSQRMPQLLAPGPSEIRAYYRANREQLKGTPLVKVRVLKMPSGPERDTAWHRADGIRRELQFAPDRFEMRVRDFAGPDDDASKGGLLTFTDPMTGQESEWLPVNVLSSLLGKAIEGLRPGAVSDLVEAEDAFALVKLEGVRRNEPLPLEKISDRIAKRIRSEDEVRAFNIWTDFHLHETYMVDGAGVPISPESFMAGASAEAGPSETGDGPDDAGPGD